MCVKEPGEKSSQNTGRLDFIVQNLLRDWITFFPTQSTDSYKMKTFKFTTEIFLFDAFVSVAYLLIVTIEYIKNSFVTLVKI